MSGVQTRTLTALWAIVFQAFAGQITDLNGRPVQPIGSGVSVLIFTRTDCPISNRYAPEINAIYQRFNRQDVKFWLVYVNDSQIHSHLKEFGYAMQAIPDRSRELVRLAGVSVTPEVAVYAAEKLVYRGRIDDRYERLGVDRKIASTHDLINVLQALTTGSHPSFRSTKAVGCFIEASR